MQDTKMLDGHTAAIADCNNDALALPHQKTGASVYAYVLPVLKISYAS